MKLHKLLITGAMALTLGTSAAFACSRVLYVGDTTATAPDSVLRIVGRSLDWATPIPTNLFVYPRGIKKQSNASSPMYTWTSRYGSVYATSYDAGITEGMNEKGLVVNGLFCRQTVYNNPATDDKPAMSLAMFPAWLLDLNATTEEVVAAVKDQPFRIVGSTFDGGTASTLHWGVTDATGRCAVIEFVDGHIRVYEGQDMPVLTNEPQWPEMLAVNEYWKSVGGVNFLPRGVRSTDRFVRANFYDSSVERTNDADTGLAIVRSIMANVSVPYRYVKGDKNLSQTQWRSYSNIRDRRYYFQNVTDLGLYYVDLCKCNLSKGAPVMYLNCQNARDYAGDVTSLLVPSKPFIPMY